MVRWEGSMLLAVCGQCYLLGFGCKYTSGPTSCASTQMYTITITHLAIEKRWQILIILVLLLRFWWKYSSQTASRYPSIFLPLSAKTHWNWLDLGKIHSTPGTHGRVFLNCVRMWVRTALTCVNLLKLKILVSALIINLYFKSKYVEQHLKSSIWKFTVSLQWYCKFSNVCNYEYGVSESVHC